MTCPLRLDHVAVLVRDTERALGYFRDRLGLPVVSTEVVAAAGVRLTYLDAGAAFVQLVEPLRDDCPAAADLVADGEGLHHIAFAVGDVAAAAAGLADDGAPAVRLGSGRGRPSAFVPGDPHHGVRVEVTQDDAAHS